MQQRFQHLSPQNQLQQNSLLSPQMTSSPSTPPSDVYSLLLQVIAGSGGNGIDVGGILNKVSRKTINKSDLLKALKVLISRDLIYETQGYNTKGRIYLTVGISPSSAITGGVFYTSSSLSSPNSVRNIPGTEPGVAPPSPSLPLHSSGALLFSPSSPYPLSNRTVTSSSVGRASLCSPGPATAKRSIDYQLVDEIRGRIVDLFEQKALNNTISLSEVFKNNNINNNKSNDNVNNNNLSSFNHSKEFGDSAVKHDIVKNHDKINNNESLNSVDALIAPLLIGEILSNREIMFLLIENDEQYKPQQLKNILPSFENNNLINDNFENGVVSGNIYAHNHRKEDREFASVNIIKKNNFIVYGEKRLYPKDVENIIKTLEIDGVIEKISLSKDLMDIYNTFHNIITSEEEIDRKLQICSNNNTENGNINNLNNIIKNSVESDGISSRKRARNANNVNFNNNISDNLSNYYSSSPISYYKLTRKNPNIILAEVDKDDDSYYYGSESDKIMKEILKNNLFISSLPPSSLSLSHLSHFGSYSGNISIDNGNINNINDNSSFDDRYYNCSYSNSTVLAAQSPCLGCPLLTKGCCFNCAGGYGNNFSTVAEANNAATEFLITHFSGYSTGGANINNLNNNNLGNNGFSVTNNNGVSSNNSSCIKNKALVNPINCRYLADWLRLE